MLSKVTGSSKGLKEKQRVNSELQADEVKGDLFVFDRVSFKPTLININQAL